MSYRSFKHLLGETSLERKCRYIFAAGILILVTASFYWYGQKTESLVAEQTTRIAQAKIEPTFDKLHYKAWATRNFATVIEALSLNRSTLGGPAEYETLVINPYRETGTGAASTSGAISTEELDKFEKEPTASSFEREAIARFVSAADAQEAFQHAGTPRPKPFTFATARRCGAESRSGPSTSTSRPSCSRRTA